MDVISEMLWEGALIAAPGLLVIVVVTRALRKLPTLLQQSIHSLLLALVLTPTIAFDTPHGAEGFPAVLALIGNGPAGFADSVRLGVLPIATMWILIFAVFRLRTPTRGTDEIHTPSI